MNTEKLNAEILELTIKLNNALVKLDEEGDWFKDKSTIDNVFTLNQQLSEKIKLKNHQGS